MNIEKLVLEGRTFRNIPIDKDFLINKGLTSSEEITINGTSIGLSKPYYSHLRKDKAFIGYINKSNKSYARTFFLSRSQGVYRVLKAYKYKVIDNVEYPKWHDKGYGEESITLPFEIQAKLSQLFENEVVYEEFEGELFYGLAEESSENNQFNLVVDREPLTLNPHLTFSNQNKIEPSKLVVKNPSDFPDFSKVIGKWNAPNKLIENVEIYTFLSLNRSLKYAFATDRKLFSWIVAVQFTESSVTKFGVFEKWVRTGDFATPPFEYCTELKPDGTREIDQTGGYGNEEMRVKHYVDMYKNYISKIPLVQEFNKSLNLSIRI
jgi:hypothetical protein